MIKPLIVLLTLSFTVVAFQNCSQQQFKNANKNTLVSVEQSSSDDRTVMNYSRETTLQNGGDLDILWVVDNSGSMYQEAAHIRSNFENFIFLYGT